MNELAKIFSFGSWHHGFFPKKPYATFTFILLFSAVLTAPSVVRLTPYSQNNQLKLDTAFENLFTEKTTGTILSGLPMNILITFKLMEERKEFKKFQIPIKIEYDVWDEIFSVSFIHDKQTFKHIDSVQVYIQNLKSMDLCSIHELKPSKEYYVTAQVRISTISEDQDKNFWNWLNQNVQEKDLNDESGKEYSFNINALVRFFLGVNGNEDDKSPWFESQPFTINQLLSR